MGNTASSSDTRRLKKSNMNEDPTLRKVILRHGKSNDTSATVFMVGATLVSWKVDGKEKIFVSNKAIWDGTKPVRGGVPICFPNFGPWNDGPQHGFARSSKEWKVVQEPQVDQATGDAHAVFVLADSDATRKLWNKKFELRYTVILKTKSLQLIVDVSNSGREAFDLTFCFHTYFKVPRSTECRISNLKGLTYTDKTKEGWPEVVETRDPLQVDKFTDSVYAKAPDTCVLSGLADGSSIKLSKAGLDDWVVWNPWHNISKMSDMHEDAHLEMLCVEATQNSRRANVYAGGKWSASHTLTVQ